MISTTAYKVVEPQTGVSCEVVLHEIGGQDTPVVFCVHGLTRSAKDFYPLARHLCNDYRVVMPDIPGRGQSQYLDNPALYNNGFYASLMAQLLVDLNIKRTKWIGTSMGGIIGMVLAATKPKAISSLILNDIGSLLPAAALARIKEYVGVNAQSDNYDELAKQVQKNLEPFGIQDPNILDDFVQASIIKTEGGYRLNYDSNITASFAEWGDEDVDLSELWNAIRCRTLIIRGENSDLLLKETAEDMASKNKVELFEVQQAGHAPSLTRPEEIEKIRNWLKQPS